ncbi:MAG: hypothetical protein OXE94_13630 [Aestuariivita sp.]|nr:hypothetical protein [Aestuariivita sp.]MCY4202974.1 hypothetical protein [Aestuariivita sp.]
MTLDTIKLANRLSSRMQDALELPNGSRFFRCALQVNPFAYLERFNNKTSFESEAEYNDAIIKACIESGIEVIAVTDHYRVDTSVGLRNAARSAGLHAFIGFEAVTKDGVHFLCLFDPNKDELELERFIGQCGIHDKNQQSPLGDKDCTELLKCAKEWGAVCIAAHVASKGGLLKKLSGQSRVNVWTSSDLLACALPSSVSDAPNEIKPILENKNAAYKRDRPLAVVNASDVSDPSKLKKNSASCFIKMSGISAEAFRQAFLDAKSRIRLHSDPEPTPHSEFVAMTWDGGFLGDAAVHFNANLNVLVGGRGTGKSTLIESLRYVLGLEPLGEEARIVHNGVVKNVLRSGTKVSLLVRSHKLSEHYYLIERSVPNPPVVMNAEGEVLNLSPSEVIPRVGIFGQHEISELAKSPEKCTLLLEGFIERNPSLAARKSEVRGELERSRTRIMEVRREIERLDERLSALPGLEEMQRHFQQAGLEERLREKSQLIREDRLFATVDERLDQYRALQKELAEGLPIDTAFVSGKAVKVLLNSEIFSEIAGNLEVLGGRLEEISDQFGKAIAEADLSIAGTKSIWNERKTRIEETYEKLLRELQKSEIDGAEFIELRQQIEELRPLNEKMQNHTRSLELLEEERRDWLAEWEEIKASEFRQIEKAARRVSQELSDKLQVSVKMAGDLDPLEKLLQEVRGHLDAAMKRLRGFDDLSLREFAETCRAGKDALMERYQFPIGVSERITKAGRDLFMRIEELELPTITEIKLNTAPEGELVSWQSLQALSTGQMATAVLLLLLLDSEAPLVVDQPEDDLDNRFITESVVPIMRQEKCRRQFIFSTHNANIPVLGDAELILGLASTGVASEGRTRISRQHMASIDSEPVRKLVEEILEGGRAAFEIRRSKYGF